MSKFEVGDRVVVVNRHTVFTSRHGEVIGFKDDQDFPVKVLFDGDCMEVCFREDELEFEHVYDELSKKPEIVLDLNVSEEDKAEVLKSLSSASKVDTRPSDAVSHPSHYADGWSNGSEVIDITEHLNFNRGNAVKYLARAGKKGGPEKEIEDLQKALWYVTREIERLGGTH